MWYSHITIACDPPLLNKRKLKELILKQFNKRNKIYKTELE